MPGSHTEWAPLEKFPYSANAGHSGENHNGQPDETKQSANAKNLRQRAELSPLEHHKCTSFPKYLKLMPALHVLLLKNLDRLNSKNPAQPCDDGGKGQLGFNILASTLRTLGLYSWILNNHGSASSWLNDVGDDGDLSFDQSAESRWWIGLLSWVLIYIGRKHHVSGRKMSARWVWKEDLAEDGLMDQMGAIRIGSP